ncbi:ATP-grasp domain-containing protein [Hymenobacter edaphi]|uniref:DUF4343 domain-containing protein n=1 Tax=Hymenobacter edaphi TaxID=2211146 RepID=A0A328BW16_9BACT|nr:ATP-grasp domain-containing protein [Hymenobacter edaphi]RAK70044.1 DUF4343 domain-containing protein [Hymenobacter edaphi]
MRAFIHQDADGHWSNPNSFVALDGFRHMGWEIVPFRQTAELEAVTLPDREPADVVVGPIGSVQAALRQLGVAVPAEASYPEALRPFLGRRLWQSTLDTVAATPDLWPVFVKPVHALKQFTGVLVRSPRDLVGCGTQGQDTAVWCAEPVRFVAEWRCFVRYGRILDLRRYRGDWAAAPSRQVVEQAVGAYADAPHGYALDFGLTDAGTTLIVEANEGYAIGAYGLAPVPYARLLAARWAQLTGTEDYCNF